ncbi:MAG: hypothetical protein AAF989_00940 [Planctomycetota bacterium]
MPALQFARPKSFQVRSLAASVLVLMAVGIIPLQANSAGAQEPISELSAEPYTVYAAQASAHARCGPSGEFYRTDRLRHGQALDVYLETDDGWLGVRPPADSFSWIPADDVELDEDGETATVSQDRSVVWIGTHLGRARRYRWQIQLPLGESVTILGRSQREGPDGPQTWFRIVPPSGEFRWVHRDQVVESAEELVAMIQEAESVPESLENRTSAGGTLAATGRETAAPRRNSRTSTSRGSLDTATQSVVPTPVSSRTTFERIANATPVERRSRNPQASSIAESPDLVPRVASDAVVDGDGFPSGARNTMADEGGLSPVQQTPQLKSFARDAAPEPSFKNQPNAGPAVAIASGEGVDINQPIGSGLRTTSLETRDSMRSTDNASGRPSAFSPVKSQARITSPTRMMDTSRLTEAVPANGGHPSAVGASHGIGVDQMPSESDVADDSNWVGGSRAAAPKHAVSSVQPVSHLEPMKVHDLGATLSRQNGNSHQTDQMTFALSRAATPKRHVDVHRVESVRREADTADIARLQLVFSRLIADSASAAEVHPIEQAARRRAENATDALVASRARVLVERAQQYQRIATRRDGQTIVAGSSGPSIPVAPASFSENRVTPEFGFGSASTTVDRPLRVAPPAMGTAPGGTMSAGTVPDASAAAEPTQAVDQWVTGRLVQVYSVRDHHPPFALRDNAGRTIAYVTPSPGFNLRRHLNSEVRVTGNHGYLMGLKTPHVLATRAVRVIE